jgi:hypothetical protein
MAGWRLSIAFGQAVIPAGHQGLARREFLARAQRGVFGPLLVGGEEGQPFLRRIPRSGHIPVAGVVGRPAKIGRVRGEDLMPEIIIQLGVGQVIGVGKKDAGDGERCNQPSQFGRQIRAGNFPRR